MKKALIIFGILLFAGIGTTINAPKAEAHYRPYYHKHYRTKGWGRPYVRPRFWKTAWLLGPTIKTPPCHWHFGVRCCRWH